MDLRAAALPLHRNLQCDRLPGPRFFQRGQGWIDHLPTHGTSLVNDFGRAVLLNPEFEPRCRPALDRARAQLGDEAFESEMARAEAGLSRT